MLFTILLTLLNILFCQEKLEIVANEKLIYAPACKVYYDSTYLELWKIEITHYEFILHLKFNSDGGCHNFELNEITGPDLKPLIIEKPSRIDWFTHEISFC